LELTSRRERLRAYRENAKIGWVRGVTEKEKIQRSARQGIPRRSGNERTKKGIVWGKGWGCYGGEGHSTNVMKSQDRTTHARVKR